MFFFSFLSYLLSSHACTLHSPSSLVHACFVNCFIVSSTIEALFPPTFAIVIYSHLLPPASLVPTCLFPHTSTNIVCSHLPIPTYFHYHRLLLHIFVIITDFCMPALIIITCSCLPTSIIVASSTILFASSPICLLYCLHV